MRRCAQQGDADAAASLSRPAAHANLAACRPTQLQRNRRGLQVKLLLGCVRAQTKWTKCQKSAGPEFGRSVKALARGVHCPIAEASRPQETDADGTPSTPLHC